MKSTTAVKVPAVAVRAASKLLKFFGPKGERWIHGTPEETDKHGVTRYCLSGAMDKLKIRSSARDAFDDILGSNVVDFNDSRKTYTHVARFLTKVANGGLKKG